MDAKSLKGRRNGWRFTLLVIGLLLIACLIYVGTRMPADFSLEGIWGTQIKSRELVASMRIELLKAVQAEKSAVLAESDEESRTYAQEALQSSDVLEQERVELGELLKKTTSSREWELFQQFSETWVKLRELDKTLLDLAVQNTNLKAFRLAVGPSREALARFENALGDLIGANGDSSEAARISSLSFLALQHAVKIQMLQAPHILESNDEKMDRMEAEMKEHDAQVQSALRQLQGLPWASEQPFLEQSVSAYRDFMRINSQIIALSRQNSNVKSLALSLGQKRRMAAQCEDLLVAMQEVLAKDRFKATR